MLKNLPKNLAASVLCVLIVLPAINVAAQSASSWDSLPEETVAALRIPNGKILAETLRGTKFGAVMFSDERKAAVIDALESDDSGEWTKFQEQLKEYGLTTEDLISLFAGESGYAMVITADENDKPMFAGLGWLEPGEDLAGKVYAVIAKLIDEQDEEQPITRVDLDLADQQVMQLRLPEITTIYTQELDYGDNYSELSADEQREAWKKAYQEWQDSAEEVVVYRTVLVGTLGNRVLVAHTYEAQQEAEASASAEQLSGIFSRWLTAHAADSGSFVNRLADHPSVAPAMSLEGMPVFEILGDVEPLIQQLRDSADGAELAEKMIRMMGLEGLGPFVARMTVEGSRWQTNMALAVPTPRQGLMQLLDQEPLAIDPPQWVPANVVSYSQLSFDLGQAYELIKEVAVREFPDQAPAGFAMAEAQAKNFAQASLSEVLSSLGNRHTYLSFGFDADSNALESEDVNERVALVWQVEDEELWSRLLKSIGPMAVMLPGAEASEEQGFSGWRVKSGEQEGGLFLGKGYLVFGYGAGIVETVLSSINNPPSGSNALRGSELFAEAGAMMDLQPSWAVEITDGNRYMTTIMATLRKHLTNSTVRGNLESIRQDIEDYEDGEDGDFDSDADPMQAIIRAILPTQQEIEGMLGIIINRWEINDDGIFVDSVQEMPGE